MVNARASESRGSDPRWSIDVRTICDWLPSSEVFVEYRRKLVQYVLVHHVAAWPAIDSQLNCGQSEHRFADDLIVFTS